VIADDLGRIFVGDDRVKGFECAHGAGDQDDGLARMLVNHNSIKSRKTIQFNAFLSRFHSVSVFT
jgi:hypothetical protein